MADPIGKQTAAVTDFIDRLCKKPGHFSFFQAVRLIALRERKRYHSEEDFLRRGLKIIPELSLSHPATDIAHIEQEANPSDPQSLRYAITATFLALYGTSSPLPTFYTEELLEEERADESVSREFLNIFNRTLYTLYCLGGCHYNLPLRTWEQQDPEMLEMQYALFGSGSEAFRRGAGTAYGDLRFTGLFLQHSRSAYNLAIYLKLRTGIEHLEIDQCVERMMPIPGNCHCILGRSRIGETPVGIRMRDAMGAFRIHLYNLDETLLPKFEPGGEGRKLLENSVRQFLRMPLEYEIVLHTHRHAPVPAILGEKTRLGINSYFPNRSATARYRCRLLRQ
ncbi:MAG: type VI secretion system baseplate subunit TssG [Desulfovibrionaceae bacterium]|nr:type VI secretion system baseplate subunit TssG [Desulfovibrionaceae bacterium]